MNFTKNREDYSPQRLLQRELAERCAKNPKYSLRSFARTLEMSPAALSMVISGARRLTPKVGTRIAAKLGLSPQETQWLLADHQIDENEAPAQQLSLDAFSVISYWYHYAILSLLEIEGARLEPRWIAKQLGISASEAKEAIARLQRLDLLVEEDGRWRQRGPMLKVDNQSSTAASRNFNVQLLQKAIASIENGQFAERSIAASVFQLDESQIEEFRQELRDLRRKLTKKYEKKGQANRVFSLGFQLFPLSERIEK